MRVHTWDVFTPTGRTNIDKTKALLSDSNGSIALGECFGNSYRHIKELGIDKYAAEERARMRLFSLRERITFSMFRTWFSLVEDRDVQYPVLDAVLKHERQLPLIHYIDDILAWHNYLYATLIPPISRDQVVLFCI